MEYRTMSTKIPSNELTLFKSHCDKKGVTPSNLIRELLLKEMKITIPNTIAGKNNIDYEKNLDTFTWSISLDNNEKFNVIQNISSNYVEELHKKIGLAINERNAFINKSEKDSVPVPHNILGESS